MRRSLYRIAGVYGLAAAMLAAMPAAIIPAAVIPAQAQAAELGIEGLTELESLLAELGFDPGPADGVADERTRSAVRLYQEFAALDTNGEPSAALLAELRQVVQVFADIKETQVAQEQMAQEQIAQKAAAVQEIEAPKASPELPDPAPPAPIPVQAAEEPAAQEPLAAPVSAPGPAPGPAAAPKSKLGFDLDSVIARLVKSNRPGKAASAAGVRLLATPEDLSKISAGQPSPPFKGKQARKIPPTRLASLSGSGDTGGDTDAGAAPKRRQSASKFPRTAARRDGYDDFKEGYKAALAGDQESAIEFYSRAIDTGDLALEHLALAFYNRANAHHYKGALDVAITDYGSAILNKPDFPGAYYNRGFSFQAKGERERAVEDFMKARSLGLQRLGVRSPDQLPPRR